MKRSTVAAIGGAAFGLAGGAAAALLSSKSIGRFFPSGAPRSAMHARPDDPEVHFRRVHEGVSRAVLWGVPEQGAYGAFTRFDPGMRNPLHKHPHDILLVVLSGAYLYMTNGGETRIEEHGCLLLPAGDIHRSGGDDQSGAVFLEMSNGAFGMQLLE